MPVKTVVKQVPPLPANSTQPGLEEINNISLLMYYELVFIDF